MTNKYVEWKKYWPIETEDFKPSTLCDVTNVNRYIEQNKLGRDFYVPINELLLNLPWNSVWFEWTAHRITRGDRCHYGVYAQEFEDTIFYMVFTDAMSHYSIHNSMFSNPFVGCEVVKKSKDGTYSRGDVTIRKDFNIYDKDRRTIMAKLVSIGSLTAAYATTFANCKNVFYYDVVCPSKIQKKRIKSGKVPQETYRIIDIGGLKKQAKSEATETEGELQRALHICRGHFKTYTKEKPLMGKFTGTYWWAMHSRGDAKNGRVNKDYTVSP